MKLEVGIKTDPIGYRYSHEWLFDLLAEEGIRNVQLGTFFELYSLPDDWFLGLREAAESRGLRISSVFTSHRELGGFFRDEPEWERLARKGYERLIEVGALLGATSVGTNPGTVPADRLASKDSGVRRFIGHLGELMAYARERGLESLTIEPMSSRAEPPTVPDEIRAMMEALDRHHREHPRATVPAGLCLDVSHGYADADGVVRCTPEQLLASSTPWIRELHVKNTDERFLATFGFGERERRSGIVDLAAVRATLEREADRLPVDRLVAYLEVGGPKVGRDSTDARLGEEIRESLEHVRRALTGEPSPAPAHRSGPVPAATRDPSADLASWRSGRDVLIAPSLMCADLTRLGDEIHRLAQVGCHWLHFDVMDAHFVPNMPLGLELIRRAREVTSLPFDVHLMVDRNDFFVERVGAIGVEWISVHAESSPHLDRTLQLIRSVGARAGVALNPGTPLEVLDYVHEHLDYLLIMTVNPGFAGQSLVPSALRKIEDARRYLDRHGLSIPLQVDGNVSFENIPRMVAAGGDVLVAGTSSLFSSSGTLAENADRVRAVAREGIAGRSDRSGSGRREEGR